MAEEDKADWEIRLQKYFEKPVAEAKVDKTLSGSQLQLLLIDIERTVGEAKKFLAANMVSEVRTQLDKIRGLLTFLEKRASGSIDEVVSLLKAGVSEKILKEIYGVADEEIQRAKKLLEMVKGGSLTEVGNTNAHSFSNAQKSTKLAQASVGQEKQPVTIEYKLLEYGVLE
jgi:signal transduction histidine kinase